MVKLFGSEFSGGDREHFGEIKERTLNQIKETILSSIDDRILIAHDQGDKQELERLMGTRFQFLGDPDIEAMIGYLEEDLSNYPGKTNGEPLDYKERIKQKELDLASLERLKAENSRHGQEAVELSEKVTRRTDIGTDRVYRDIEQEQKQREENERIRREREKDEKRNNDSEQDGA